MEIIPVVPQDEKWPLIAKYAADCSWRAGKRLAELMNENEFIDWECVFAALDGEKVMGFCTLIKTDCIADLPYTPYVGFVFVDEQCRGHRLSEKMIDTAQRNAQKLGFDRVYLVSDHKGLYEKYGFEAVAHEKAPWGEIETIFMRTTC